MAWISHNLDMETRQLCCQLVGYFLLISRAYDRDYRCGGEVRESNSFFSSIYVTNCLISCGHMANHCYYHNMQGTGAPEHPHGTPLYAFIPGHRQELLCENKFARNRRNFSNREMSSGFASLVNYLCTGDFFFKHMWYQDISYDHTIIDLVMLQHICNM